MPWEWTLKRVGTAVAAVITLVGAGSALGSTLGFRYTGPAAQLQTLAATDSFVLRQLDTLRDSMGLALAEHRGIRDSLTKAMRPVNLYICLRADPEDTAIMDLDCDLMIGTARNAYLLRERARRQQRQGARP